jgi:L-alanine-DL-glutamate epimerase-like enolase superfamily enzyme
MAIQLKSVRVERWPVAGEFVISRGATDHVDVVVAEIEGAKGDGGAIGRGEGTPIYYHGEDAAGCRDVLLRVIPLLADMGAGEARAAVQEMLGAGAARNALDCALWDLEARQRGMPLWQLAGCDGPPTPRLTAFTISLAAPDRMAVQAAAAVTEGYRLLKLKLTGEGDRARVAAVRGGAPDARLIVDANESWGQLDLLGEAEALAELGVEMIEQPVPVGADALLDGVYAPLPFVADESCQTAADIARIGTFYDGVNIKLDKAGGLTEALRLADAADAAGLGIMVGCMLSTSLAIAPAFVLAQRAPWVDLDGPALLARDREDGFRFEGGRIVPPPA